MSNMCTAMCGIGKEVCTVNECGITKTYIAGILNAEIDYINSDQFSMDETTPHATTIALMTVARIKERMGIK